MKTLDCNITLCRSSNNLFYLEIEDKLSGVNFLEISITPEEIGNLISTRPTKGEMRLRDLSLIGLKREYKSEKIPIPSYFHGLDPETYLKPYEIDGWMGSRTDFKNSHRYSRVDGQSYMDVGFVRYVVA